MLFELCQLVTSLVLEMHLRGRDGEPFPPPPR